MVLTDKGTWVTSGAKEYRAGMCNIIAEGVIDVFYEKISRQSSPNFTTYQRAVKFHHGAVLLWQ